MLDTAFAWLMDHPGQTSAITAIGGICLAAFSFCVATTSLFVSIKSMRNTRRHNIKSQMPIIYIQKGNFSRRLVIAICNYGNGPLIITDFKAIHIFTKIPNFSTPNCPKCQFDEYHQECRISRENIIDLCPDVTTDIEWNRFAGIVKDRVVPSKDFLTLLEIEFDENSHKSNPYYEKLFSLFLKKSRDVISDITIEVSYRDIYEKKYPVHVEKLNWMSNKNIKTASVQKATS